MKYDLIFDPPLMNAAGSLGFAPALHGPLDLACLGAFITNPVSLAARTPAQSLRCLPYPGGFLLHTGYPNPGLSTVIRQNASRWARSPRPVIVHLLCQDADELAYMVQRLEGLAGVAGVELGLPPGADAPLACTLVQAASGELPVILRLPFENAVELASALAAALPSTAVSLAPPRGALVAQSGALLHGRLYGPAIFPLALEKLQAVARSGLPVIAAGGIYQPGQVEIMHRAGALAVQLDAVLWRGGWPAPTAG
ncbi:MAG: hypothetical protein AB1894_25735 [Chloroflexota bacterium]